MKRILLATLLLSACASEPGVPEKLDQADAYLSEHGGEPGYRAAAYDLYLESLEDASTQKERVRAHFGLGMIGLFDLVQGLPRILETDPAKEGEESDLPPADALAKTVDTLVHVAIDQGIVRHLEVVAAEEDFSFTFKKLVFPVTDVTETPVDLSGEWDLAEVRMLYGIAQVIVAVEEFGYSYDGLFEAIMTVALSGEPLPELPSNPRDMPAWLVDAAKISGLEPLPWLDPAFGKLGEKNRIASVKDRLDKGFASMAGAMTYVRAEEDEQKGDVFPKTTFTGTVIAKLVRPGSITLTLVGGFLTTDVLLDVFERLHNSVVDAKKPFIIPESLLDPIETVIGGLYDGPNNLVDLRVPAISPGNLLDDPITDLKAAGDGLFPAFDKQGGFIVESEQEPWTDKDNDGNVDDDEYKDTGVDGFVGAGASDRVGADNGVFDFPLAFGPTLTPLKHKSPAGSIDAPNDIIDPVYLFFGDATLHGLFVPIAWNSELRVYEPDLGDKYTNGDLMRLVSSLAWLIQEQ